MDVIVYKSESGGVAVFYPNEGSGLSIDQMALVAVPVEAIESGVIRESSGSGAKVEAGSFVERSVADFNGIKHKDINHEVIDHSELPESNMFRGAWRLHGREVREDLQASKEIAHTFRRQLRTDEFLPLDHEAMVCLADPERLSSVEACRQKVREKYAAMQEDIDSCGCAKEIREAIFRL